MSADAHSSIHNTLGLLEMDALVVPAKSHRLTGEAARAAIAADGDPASLAVDRGDVRHHERGHHR